MMRKMLPALLFVLLPAICHAQEFDKLDRLAIAVGDVVMAAWVWLSIMVFLINRRKTSVWKRLGLASLFLISPAVLFALILFKAYAFGDEPTQVTVTTNQPMAVVGITFPAGSRAEYEQTGGFLGWRAERKLLGIRSPHPLALNNFHVDGLWLSPTSDGLVALDVSEDETIEGWRCSPAFPPQMNSTPTGLKLKTCQLAVPHLWRGQVIPAGTFVSRDGADWSFISS